MAVRTFSIKFLGEVADFQKKAKMAKSSLDDVRTAATSPGLENALGRMSNIGDSLKGAGTKVSNFGGGLTKYITAPAVGAVSAVAGIALATGWGRLKGLDSAKLQIEAMKLEGVDAAKVINEDVLNALEGSAFTLQEAGAQAAGFLSTGIKPGKDLEEQIRLVADATTRSTADFSGMSRMMMKVEGNGKLTGEVMTQMAENGLFVMPMLQDAFGKTGEEIQKMVSDGKVSSTQFKDILEKNVAGAAQASGDSAEGMVANFKTAFSNLGALVLGEVFPQIKESFKGATELFRSDEFSAKAKEIGQSVADGFGKAVDGVKRLVEWWGELSPQAKKLAGVVAIVAVAAGPFLIVVGKMATGMGAVLTVAPKLVAGIAAIATPVGLIVAGIALLVAGLVWFFTQTELGRTIVEKAWAGIKSAAAAVVDWWTTTAQPALTEGWAKVKDAAAVVADWFQNDLMPVLAAVWDGIKSAAKDAADWYNTHLAPVFSAFGELFSAVMERIAQVASWLWETNLKPTFGFIGAAWSVLWAAVQLAWDKIGPPLMAYIGGAFNGMKIVLSTIWDSIKIYTETALGVIKGVIKTVTALINGDWAGAWEAVKETFRVAWDGTRRLIERVVGGVRDWLGSVWTTIKNTAKTAWEGVRDEVMGVVNPLRDKIVGAFEAAKDGISDAFIEVKAAAAVPINFVINTVWNDGLRKVIGMIPGVEEPGRVTPIKGYEGGGHTGWGSRTKKAGDVHGREYVLTAPETEKMGGPRGVEDWKRIILEGQRPGYEKGGYVWPTTTRRLTPNYGGHSGIDIPAPAGTPTYAVQSGRVGHTGYGRGFGKAVFLNDLHGQRWVYGHHSSIGVSPGQSVGRGQRLGGIGTTGNSTGNHLHIEAAIARFGQARNRAYTFGLLTGSQSPGATDPGAASLLALPGKIAGIISGIKKTLTGPWGGMIKTGFLLDAVLSAKDWMLDKLMGRGDKVGQIDRSSSRLGGYASGVRNARKGLWWAGEDGPELIHGAGGETVIPHRQSLDLAAQVVGKSSSSRSQSDVDAIFERLIAAMESREPAQVHVSLDEGDIRRVVRAELRNSKTGA